MIPEKEIKMGQCEHCGYNLDGSKDHTNCGQEHRYDLDTDRCICGGQVVFFDDPDLDGNVGEGCEVSGRVWPHLRERFGDDEF